ncbi:hypothetical protein CPB86DRAFT_391022 [Serendipita vermifera]|nr:hypothetical protein CPB86DRAFT_391022 [Serendipita vermifera]
MDTLSDFWDILPIDDTIFTLANVPPAKPNATTTIMSLPVETLEHIVEHCSTRSLLPLMKTNRTLYKIAVPRLYSTVHIHLDYHGKQRRLRRSKAGSLQDLNRYYIKFALALSGRSKHLKALCELHIAKLKLGPSPQAHKLFHSLLERAPFIQKVEFRQHRPHPSHSL